MGIDAVVDTTFDEVIEYTIVRRQHRQRGLDVVLTDAFAGGIP
ncbi:MAG: hypothetical protein R2856_14795 [Caldilineaceae bacterium]